MTIKPSTPSLWDDLKARVLAQSAENKRLLSERAELVAALRPFAILANGKDRWDEDAGCAVFPTVGQVRAARALLARLGEGA